MSKLKAKPISDSFWILKKGNNKVGRVIQRPEGYSVQINGEGEHLYTSLKKLKESKDLEFDNSIILTKTDIKEVHSYPTDSVVFNAVWDRIHNLPVFTKEKTSKSLYAAGYYQIIINKRHIIEFCPKLITLERNLYSGPYMDNKCVIY